MAIRRVLYQTVFQPFRPLSQQTPVFRELFEDPPHLPARKALATAATAALMAFSFWTPQPASAAATPVEFTPFDVATAKPFLAAEQQFGAWYSLETSSQTPVYEPKPPFDVAVAKPYPAAQQEFSAYGAVAIPPQLPPPEFTAFDVAVAKPYGAWQQQYSSWYSLETSQQTPVFKPFPPFDVAVVKAYQAAEQQFSAYGETFFAQTTPLAGLGGSAAPSVLIAQRYPKYGANQQQFIADALLPPVVATPVFEPYPPFDVAIAKPYPAAEQQFGYWHSLETSQQTPAAGLGGSAAPSVLIAQHQPKMLASQQQFIADVLLQSVAATTTPTVFTPFDVTLAKPYGAWQQQFTAYHSTVFPSPYEVPTPFDAIVADHVPASIQQFQAWHSFVPVPTIAAPFMFSPFDMAKGVQYAAGQQQFDAFQSFVPPPGISYTLTDFYVEPLIVRYPAAQGVLPFVNTFPPTPESTTVSTEVVLGRWGPDESSREKKRRWYYQWEEPPLEEQPQQSEFAPDPVEHPPHEPQKWADEPAAVRTVARASPISGVEHLAAVLADVPEELDDETLEYVEMYLKIVQAYFK